MAIYNTGIYKNIKIDNTNKRFTIDEATLESKDSIIKRLEENIEFLKQEIEILKQNAKQEI